MDWSWGLLGEALGAIWAPKAAWHRKKEPDDQKKSASGLHFGVYFRYRPLFFDVFLRSFSSLRFDGYQDRFFMDFDQFVGSFLEVFFISLRIVGK